MRALAILSRKRKPVKMKYTLLTCCLLAAALNQVSAQISRNTFSDKVSELKISISKGNNESRDKIYAELEGMMKTQITFLIEDFKKKQYYVHICFQKATDLHKESIRYLDAMTRTNNTNDQQNDLLKSQKAQADEATQIAVAHNYEREGLTDDHNFTKDSKISDDLKVYKVKMEANKEKIIASLNDFASTL